MNKEKLTDQWNKVYSEFQGNRLSVWREEASHFFSSKIDYLKHLGLNSVLDAGCGDGRNLIEFANAGFNVTGIDMSDKALERCKKNTKQFSNVTLKQGTLENLDFKNEFFDIVICDFVTAHMEKPEKILENFFRILKKEGYLLIEFTSTKDPHCGEGEKIRENEFLQKGIYVRFYTLKQVQDLMKNFNILFIDSSYYSDPEHGSGYNRTERHTHHSYFVIAKK